jgi:hypothetical protein
MNEPTPIRIPHEDLLDLLPEARAAIRAARLPELLAEIDPGAYGTTRTNLELLEALEHGIAALSASRRALTGRIAADRRAGFAGGALTAEEQESCSLLAVRIGLEEALALLAPDPGSLPPAERHLKLAEYRRLLTAGEPELVAGLLADLVAYLGFYRAHPDPRLRLDGDRLQACAVSFLSLVARTAARLGDDGQYASILAALAEHGLSLAGTAEYRGFERRGGAVEPEDNDLLPVAPDDIVGNQEVLEAGLALARAVAGFDLASGRNPRMVRNPVLFVMGTPGCGKTVTAHAIGQSFLALCRRHRIPARFRIIRRTDWASHYQNRSANELLRIFKEEIFEFPGVAGAYWPDIDTAFAAREDPGIRAEEKAVLGTLFGLLDGTIGPRNGKWFLIADANTLTLDRAAVSRLTQDPFHARGPTTADDFVVLLRDKKLARVHEQLTVDDPTWRAFGDRCVAEGLSGRAVDNMAGKILSEIEAVELPDAYFGQSLEEKEATLQALRKRFDGAALNALLERYVRFEKEAEERARRERFERRVTEIREQLAAQVAARPWLGGENDGEETTTG